jgi:acyl carrier protein
MQFDPQNRPEEPSTPRTDEKHTEGNGNGSASAGATKPLARFRGYREIAVNLNSADRIHQRFESKAAVKEGNREGYVAPRNALEKQLCELWEKLLHIAKVGAKDNFFELGGHSLLAVRLFSEIEKLTGTKLPLVTIFQSPTVRQLAKALSHDDSASANSLLVPLQPKGNKPPLFLVHGAGGDVLWGYANLAAHLPRRSAGLWHQVARADAPRGIRDARSDGRELRH